ncbi:IS200/IS605 family transposase [Streptomyces gamaensis]|uniref:IS200/IS605 family transposase n=1 Tax=Streptomyces gamaensis TaxID=1763542 RepID=A0ABW0Z0Q9_9ACTN
MSPRWESTPAVRRGRSVVRTLHAHVVSVPQYRRKVFADAIFTRREEVAPKVCEDFGAELREFNSETGYVHPLVHYPPAVALSRLVGSLKGVFARRLRQGFPDHISRYLWGEHFWPPSHFPGSCGGALPAIVKEYIESQKRPG